MQPTSKLQIHDRPIVVVHETITLDISAGPNLGDLVYAIGSPVSFPFPTQPLSFTVKVPIRRESTSLLYTDYLSVIIVSLHRYSEDGVALRGYFADRRLQGYHRTFDAHVAPYLEFGNYRIAGARSGSLTFPKDAYEAYVKMLVRKYTD